MLLKDKGINEKKKIKCNITFLSEIKTDKEATRKFHNKSIIEYTFGWSSAKLFPTEKKHVEFCDEKPKEADAESYFEVVHPMDLLNFVISFENGIKVKNVYIYRDDEKIGELKRNDDLYYTKYVFGDIRPCINEIYCIRWSYLVK